jgi:hypothetical protein
VGDHADRKSARLRKERNQKNADAADELIHKLNARLGHSEAAE